MKACHKCNCQIYDVERCQLKKQTTIDEFIEKYIIPNLDVFKRLAKK